MGDTTAISWCDHTFNPWIGCARVSPGCLHCYAETYDQRWSDGEHWGKQGSRRVTSDANWRKPLKWDREAAEAGVRRRVFCASLADVFEDRPDLVEPRERLWTLIAETPNLDWLLLTKRPENFAGMLPWMTAGGCHADEGPTFNPWPNVWLGTSVEDQQRADERIPPLLDTPAAVRFLSMEPLLGPVTLNAHQLVDTGPWPAIHWVIVGGESGGNHARPMHTDWARDIRDQCVAAGVPLHFKQWGSWRPWRTGDDGDTDGSVVYMDDDGPRVPWSDPEDESCLVAHRQSCMTYTGVSGHSAGRELDGRTWDQFPEVPS